MDSNKTRFTLLSMLAIGSCAALTPRQIPDSQREHSPEMQSLHGRINALEESITLLACGPELKALFRDIRKECVDTCRTDQIHGAVVSAKRELNTRSMGQTLLTLLRHEVVYPLDRGQPSSDREKRLNALVTERRLPSTRFLIVTAPLPNPSEAERRAQAVIGWLTSHGLSDREIIDDGEDKRQVQRFDKPWIYRLDISPQALKPADRPLAPEPRDFDKAVYVFRTECM